MTIGELYKRADTYTKLSKLIATHKTVINLGLDEGMVMERCVNVLTRWYQGDPLIEVRSVNGFLSVITNHGVRDARRDHFRDPYHKMDRVDLFDIDYVSDETIDHRQLETVATVKAAIEQLSPQQQRVIEACMDESQTLTAIAKDLGISFSTARNHRDMAYEKLRHLLRKFWEPTCEFTEECRPGHPTP